MASWLENASIWTPRPAQMDEDIKNLMLTWPTDWWQRYKNQIA